MTRMKAVLFDCDGVLLDSEPLGCEALAQAMTAAGRPMDMHAARDMFSGHSADDARKIMTQAGLDADAVTAHADALLYAMFEQHIPPLPGVERVLADVPLAMAVCSNATRLRLNLSIVKTPLAARFGRHIYSANDVANPKPAPDMALLACREMGISPAEAIFVDDNTHGVRCGKAAGCISVGFVAANDDRPGHAETLRAAGADYVVQGHDGLHALLTTLTADTFEDA